jgi:hypothetical protein
MPSDHALPTSRARPFATVAYVPGGAAVLEPAVMPQSCVHASPGDPACVLVVHHVRQRKTGPQIPVTIRAHLSRAVHYQPICNEAASAQLVYCQSICNEPCLWACNATPAPRRISLAAPSRWR